MTEPAPTAPPLVVDLDGTLTPTDTLVESVLALVRRQPGALPSVLAALPRGRAAFKQAVAEQVEVDAAALPYREDLLAYLTEQRRQGRRLVLATAAERRIAQAVADRLQLFDEVIATEDGHNLKGAAKRDAIRTRVGARYAYAGDSVADLPVWRDAEAAVLVGVPDALAAEVGRHTPVERRFDGPRASLHDWLAAVRLHQWSKNLLLLVPLLTSFGFHDLHRLTAALLAFLAFSLVASGTYLLNDLWDLPHDRLHPRKRQRALAAGRIAPQRGAAVALGLVGAGFGLALGLPGGFALALGVYLVATTAYSLWLKSHALVDVISLSVLYTLRILAGAAAIGVQVSPWLLAFSVFLFFSLAVVKRCAELEGLERAGQPRAPGRGYRVSDLRVLWPLGVSASVGAVVVFGLYINTPETRLRFASPDLLWLVGIGLLYALARLWVKTSRGEMHDDPVVFALRDRGVRVTVLCMVLVTLVAALWRSPGA